VIAPNGRGAPPLLELRQYAMKPGQRDALLALFEEQFLEAQEDVGMTVPGHFRELDHPDLFVWLRGFADLPARRAGLEAFYSGPVWREHRGRANATMASSDNALLLREARPGSALDVAGAVRPPRTLAGRPSPLAGLREGFIEILTYSLRASADAELIAAMCDDAPALLAEVGGALVGVYVTETAANNYPRLPLREGEPTLVTVTTFASAAAHAEGRAALARASGWRARLAPLLDARVTALEVRRLVPAARSLLRG
jgi:hypothetical protein